MLRRSRIAAFVLALLCAAAHAQSGPVSFQHGLVVERSPAGTLEVQAVLPNCIRIHVLPAGVAASPRTPVMDPAFTPAADLGSLRGSQTGQPEILQAAEISVAVGKTGTGTSLSFRDRDGREFLREDDPFAHALRLRASFTTAPDQDWYGMRGLDRRDTGAGILRQGGADIAAGIQGDGGAPFFFTTRFGVLVDSDGGHVNTTDSSIEYTDSSRADLEYFVFTGPPMASMSTLSTLTGRPPMPPRWTLGFTNTQWGIDQPELTQIVKTYREKHIPIDGFIVDFDWKAWGQDDYGEWRWNSDTAPGAVEPNKFPGGASGVFGREMAAQGFKLGGILKPRIIVGSPTDPNKLMIAAAYAKEHGFGVKNEVLVDDYVTHRQSMNIDFSLPDARSWFWEHLKPAYHAGMVAWWNDEADYSSSTVFSNFQHFNMGRMLWDGQRADAPDPAHAQRVWSLNRNFYLGAARYGGAEWSGDIQTGFHSMALQRRRMLSTVDLGEPQWSMDTGGFNGHPTSENYARWIEFAAFVPIFRVHGDHDEHRQPWVYGPVAEAAARQAMELRYTLLPYLYSNTDTMHRTGIGLVRPMFWAFPDDPHVRSMDTEWMFGEALLVSPVVTRAASTQTVYLPAGDWFDFNRGTHLTGAQTIEYPVDKETWKDIPLFVRAGSIVATQVPQDYTDQHPVEQIALDIFPGRQAASFTVYDDDGKDFAYESGAFFRQQITAAREWSTSGIEIALSKPAGSYRSPLRSYQLRIHAAGTEVTVNGNAVPATFGTDKFGPVATVEVPPATRMVTLR